MSIVSTFRVFGTLAALLAVTGPASTQELQKIVVATSSSSITAGAARLAKELGLYEKHGLDATVTPMQNGSVTLASLISGSVSFVTTGATDVLVAQGRGQKLVALASGYRGTGVSVILSKAVADRVGVSPTAPIKDRLSALDGLTFASPTATASGSIVLKGSAESAGAKIKLTYMDPSAIIAAFETRSIEGYVLPAPYYVQPLLRGSGLMWLNGPKGEFPYEFAAANTSVLATKREYAEANPKLMKQITAVFADFSDAVVTRPAEVKAAMAKLWPELQGPILDVVFETESRGYNTKPMTVADIVHDIDVLKRGGVDMPPIDNPAALLFP